MKALRVERLSDDLSGVALADLAAPVAAPGEVLVRVRAASLNYPDLLMTRGAYQFKPEVPFTCGHGTGGRGGRGRCGQRVRTGRPRHGRGKDRRVRRIRQRAGRSLRPVPRASTSTQAAALGAAYTTAYTALVELGGLQPGQWVLVHGAGGGVGLAACDLARALGARVIAATHDPAKAERIRAAVSPEAVIVNHGRFASEVAALTGGALCDLVLDPVGGDVFDESTRCVAFGGKLLVVGFVAGRIPRSRSTSR